MADKNIFDLDIEIKKKKKDTEKIRLLNQETKGKQASVMISMHTLGMTYDFIIYFLSQAFSGQVITTKQKATHDCEVQTLLFFGCRAGLH